MIALRLVATKSVDHVGSTSIRATTEDDTSQHSRNIRIQCRRDLDAVLTVGSRKCYSYVISRFLEGAKI